MSLRILKIINFKFTELLIHCANNRMKRFRNGLYLLNLIPLGSQTCRNSWIMLVFGICGALCVLLSPFFFRHSEVCFYFHFGYLVNSSTVFNLCVANIYILCFKHVSIICNRDPILRSFTPLFSPTCVLFLISAIPLPQSKLD